jgi:hypothetical protein
MPMARRSMNSRWGNRLSAAEAAHLFFFFGTTKVAPFPEIRMSGSLGTSTFRKTAAPQAVGWGARGSRSFASLRMTNSARCPNRAREFSKSMEDVELDSWIRITRWAWLLNWRGYVTLKSDRPFLLQVWGDGGGRSALLQALRGAADSRGGGGRRGIVGDQREHHRFV